MQQYRRDDSTSDSDDDENLWFTVHVYNSVTLRDTKHYAFHELHLAEAAASDLVRRAPNRPELIVYIYPRFIT